MGRRIVNFANLPIKLLMPSSFSNITEIALKTIPSATKIEIKRVLESLYGFEVDRVHTLNMEGKKIKRGGILLAKPDYKKAYVTLRNPLSLNPDLYPIKLIEEEWKRTMKESKSTIVEDTKRSHWLDQDKSTSKLGDRHGRFNKPERVNKPERRRHSGEASSDKSSIAKFPWSSMNTRASTGRS